MAFPRTNCRTTTATVLTVTAGATLSLRVCVCASRPNHYHNTTAAGAFHNVHVPKQFGTGKPCVFLSGHISQSLPSQGEELRTGESDVYQLPIAGLTPLALCCPIGEAPRVNVDFPLSMWCCVPFCPMPLSQVHRQADLGDEEDGSKGDAVKFLGDEDGCRKRGVLCGHLARHISQDSLTLSWCEVSPQLLDDNDGGDCVKSSSDAGVRTMFDFFFRVCYVARTAFSGDVNTQNHTWTSGLPVLVINIVFFVAFLCMRCLPPSLGLAVFTLFGCPSVSPLVRLVYFHFGPEPREGCLFRRTGDSTGGRATFDREGDSTGGRATFCIVNLAYLARQSLFSLVQPRNAAGCLHLRRPRRTETTVCRVTYMVLVPFSHSHSNRHEASSRARRWSWRPATVDRPPPSREALVAGARPPPRAPCDNEPGSFRFGSTRGVLLCGATVLRGVAVHHRQREGCLEVTRWSRCWRCVSTWSSTCVLTRIEPVVYLCLSSSSDDRHLLHSCLGTGMRIRTQKPVLSCIVHLWFIRRPQLFFSRCLCWWSDLRNCDKSCSVCAGKHVTVSRYCRFCAGLGDCLLNPCNFVAQLVTSQPDAVDTTMTFSCTDVLGPSQITRKQHVSSTVHSALARSVKFPTLVETEDPHL